MHLHFIAIGGSAMHNLAIALHKKGYTITGSDDEIVEPSKSNLAKYGILPLHTGWNEACITKNIDAVILGMHARNDNPELLKAINLGLKIYSYPEYLYEQCKNKKRIVIGGSHGKTTVTAMIMHVLKQNHIEFDYMVGSSIQDFDTMVHLSENAKYAVFEGDEYLSSPIDLRPKFHLYKPHIAVITGISWDHINVFPTYENYIFQFQKFIECIEPNGSLIYFNHDDEVKKLAINTPNTLQKIPYQTHDYTIKNNITFLKTNTNNYPLKIFGEHNLQNIAAAKNVCTLLGITDNQFYNSISTFNGAAKRLQIIGNNSKTSIYLDFAHSPSKVLATIRAVKQQFANRLLCACLELHTFSSLTEKFLHEYKNTMNQADEPIVYFNSQTIEHKKLKMITPKQVIEAFENPNLKVFTEVTSLFDELIKKDWNEKNLLLMSSGNFSGADIKTLVKKIISNT